MVAGSNNSTEELNVTTRHDIGHTDPRGGVHMTNCRWGSTGAPIVCGFYDTADAERFVDRFSPEGTTSASPLAAPFMSLTHSGRRFAVFPAAFTGGSSTRIMHIKKGDYVRSSKGVWAKDSYGGKKLEVQVCLEHTGGPPQNSVCAWAVTTESDFALRMRARYPAS